MSPGHFRIDDFRRIEGHIHDRTIYAMPIAELNKLKLSLLTSTPPAEIHPIIQKRWDRAYTEISSIIDSKVAKRRFQIAIMVSSVILIVSLINLIRGFM